MTDYERLHWEKYRANWIAHALQLRIKLESSSDLGERSDLLRNLGIVMDKIIFATELLEDEKTDLDSEP